MHIAPLPHREAQQKALDYAKGGMPDAIKSWLSKDDFDRNNEIQLKARELGVSEDALRTHLETLRIQDWSVPLTPRSHEHQNGWFHGLARHLGIIGLAEPTRMLPDGRILPNPELGSDRAKFDAAIDASMGTQEARAEAKALWGQYHDNHLSNVRAALEKMQALPGVESYMQWRDRMHAEGKVNHRSENELTEQYMEQQKGRDWFTKLMDNVSSSILAGSHDLVAGIVGTAGLITGGAARLTGSDMLQDLSHGMSTAAGEKMQEAENAAAALQHTGNDGLGASIISSISRALPSLAATAATGGTLGTAAGVSRQVLVRAATRQALANASARGAALGAIQSAGTVHADLYKHHIGQGATPQEAWAASAPASAASGLMTGLLTKYFPGGKEALSNPAARQAASQEMRQVVSSALKDYAAKSGRALVAYGRGALDEIPQEFIDSGFSHLAGELGKGVGLDEAVDSYLASLPEQLASSSVLGGGTEAAQSLAGGAKGPPQTQPQAPAPAPAPALAAPNNALGEQQTAQQTQQPSSTSSSQPSSSPPSGGSVIPVPTTRPASTPGQQQQTGTVNNGQPAPTAPSDKQPSTTVNNVQPPPTSPASDPPPPPTVAAGPPLDAAGSGRLIANLDKAKAWRPLNPREQADYDQARRVVAGGGTAQPQNGSPAPQGPSAPDAVAPPPAASGQPPSPPASRQPSPTDPHGQPQEIEPPGRPSIPETPTPSAAVPQPTPSGQSPSTSSSGQPPQTAPPALSPQEAHAILQAHAQKPGAQLSDADAQRLGEAQQVRAAAIKQNLERKLEVTQKPLPPPEAKALADAIATLGRRPSGNTSPNGETQTSGKSNAGTDINANADGETDTNTNGESNAHANGNTGPNTNGHGDNNANANGNTDTNAASPTSVRQQPSPSSGSGSGSGKPLATTVNNGQPSSTPPSGQPPQTTANHSQPPQTPPVGRPSGPPLSVERSRRLIANVMAMPERARQHPTVQADLAQAQAVVAAASPGVVQAKWKASSAPEGSPQRAAADQWHARLTAMRNMTNPVSIEEAVSWKPHIPVSPDVLHKVSNATQSFLDMLPRDLVEALGPVTLSVRSSLDEGVPGQYDPATNTVSLSLQHIASYNVEELRSLVWHEMGHWLYFNADTDYNAIAKKNPRTMKALKALKAWRLKIDGHWHARTLNQPKHWFPGNGNGSPGWFYVLDGWIKLYAGRLYPDKTGGIEIPSVYLEEASHGPDRLAKWCDKPYFEQETFDIVLSIFGK